MFTPAQVSLLLSRASISLEVPWCTNDRETIEAHYRVMCDDLASKTGTLSRIEWNDYRAGFTSYIDAWFYRDTADFAVPRPLRYGEEHVGLSIILSALAPYYVFMEGEKHWHRTGGGGYLPSFEAIDNLKVTAVQSLAAQMGPLLSTWGLTRLSASDLGAPLLEGISVETNLSKAPYREFDALFNFAD